MNKVEKFIWDTFEPQIEKIGYHFVNVEYLKEKDNQFLRLFIEKVDGSSVDISDCEKVSRYLDEKLDNEASMLDKEYILEVSSPGIERPLKRLKDFEKFIQHDIKIKLYQPVNNQKIFIGQLDDINNNAIVLNIDGQLHTFLFENIAKANLHFEF